MKEQEGIDMLKNMLKKYGLDKQGWGVVLDNARHRLGLTRFKDKTISLSRHAIQYNEDGIIEKFMLHEVAHALVGPIKPVHGPIWQKVAELIGADPVRHIDGVRTPGKWQATCSDCDRTYYRTRKPAKFLYFCTACGRSSGWKKGELAWTLRQPVQTD